MGVFFCECFKDKEDYHLPYKKTAEESPKNNATPNNQPSLEPLEKLTSSKTIRKFESKASKSAIGEELLFNIDKAVIIGKGQGNPKEIYQFLHKIGEGSFGRVYIAKHKQTNNLRAIKIIKKVKNGKASWINQDIIREIDLLKSLDHQNIIKMFEFYEGEKMFYIVTEYCKGGDWFTKIKLTGELNEETTAIIMFQLFGAITYCHNRNIMHRDLKPENIMLDNKTKNGNMHIRIIDFGTAKIYENEQENQIIGTPYYIAPEVWDKDYNEKCDVWSWGVIMYVLLSKKFPFVGQNKEEIFRNIKLGKYDLISPPFDTWSNEVKNLIGKLWVVDPNKRISAEQAWGDVWFDKNKIKEKLTDLSIKLMKEWWNNIYNYNPSKVLQQAAIAYLVHNIPQMEYVRNACSLYMKIDKNNDGLITKEEFMEGLKELFSEQGQHVDDSYLEELFKIIDADNSGEIEYEEFIRAAVDKKAFLEPNNLQFAFDFFDKDKSGFITLDEVTEVFNNNDNEFLDKDFQLIIEEVDTNKDGRIDIHEFEEMMKYILKV